jgi:hypothetical protein
VEVVLTVVRERIGHPRGGSEGVLIGDEADEVVFPYAGQPCCLIEIRWLIGLDGSDEGVRRLDRRHLGLLSQSGFLQAQGPWYHRGAERATGAGASKGLGARRAQWTRPRRPWLEAPDLANHGSKPPSSYTQLADPLYNAQWEEANARSHQGV